MYTHQAFRIGGCLVENNAGVVMFPKRPEAVALHRAGWIYVGIPRKKTPPSRFSYTGLQMSV